MTKVRIKHDSLDRIINEEAQRQLPDFTPSPMFKLLLHLMILAFLIVGFTLVVLAFIEPQQQVDTLDRDSFNPVITYTRGG